MLPKYLCRLGATAASATALMVFGLFIPAGASAQDNSITIVLPEEPDSLDNCNSGRSSTGRVIRQNINESLIELDPNDGTLSPRLVTSWEQIDKSTWRFELRNGVTYSDGTPLTSQAIEKSLDKALNPNLDCNARTKMFSDITLDFVHHDDGTFDIVTSAPEPILPIRMTTVTIGHPDEEQRLLNTTTGTGPYVLDHWDTNTEIVLKRNPNYWGQAPELDGAKYVWRNQSAVAAAMVEVGEAQLAPNINQTDATNPELDFAYPNSETNYLRIESQVPPLDDKRVRLAINHAIDRSALHGTVIPEQAMIAVQMVIPRIAGHNHEINKNRFEFDPDKARQLIAEAKADGVPVDTEIDLIGRVGMWANATETLEAVHAMLTAVGLNIDFNMLEVSLWTDFNMHPNKGPNTPDSEAKVKDRAPILLGHQHDNNIGDPIFSMYNKYGCEAAASTHCWPALDEQIAEASQTPAGPERVAHWKEAMRMIHEDYAADAFLFHMVGFARVSPDINYTPTAATNSEIRLEDITYSN